MKKPELLAPAGNIEIARTAFDYGADAVYLGGSMLQLRSDSVGFTDEELFSIIKEAHKIDRKVYVTVNASAFEDETPYIRPYALKLRDMGADGVIISDLGVLSAFHDEVPELPIHVSTQANVTNSLSAKTYYDLGARRVVPAREMTLDSLIKMRKELPEDMEIETFVHGAMCMAYSGRCMLSAFMTGRNANRGGCAHPCRWNYSINYSLTEETRPDMSIGVEETEKGMAFFSSKDLCTIDFLDKIVDAGVTSFKIEGRMKTEYYVATVVGAYRKRLDAILENRECDLEQLKKELNAVSHRPYSSGFYFGELIDVPGDKGEYEYDCVYAARVEKTIDDGALITLKNKFVVNDTLEVLSPVSCGEKLTVNGIADEEGNALESASVPARRYIIKTQTRLNAGDMLRRRI